MKRSLLAVAVVSLFAIQTIAQAPQTISHQGRLTDNVGQPLTDSTWTMQFDIYTASGGAASSLWSQTSGVPTVGGIYNVILGPITGVDFNQLLWLGITVHPAGGESEISPRTPLTSVPASFAIVLPYEAKANTSAPVISVENTGSGLGFYSADSVLIETSDLTPSGAAMVNDDLIVEATNAVVGLYSDQSGSWGSSVVLGEIGGFGSLVDKWAVARQTSGATSRLVFTFGESADYRVNPMKVWFDTLGQVYASNYVHTTPKTGLVSVGPAAFRPVVFSSVVTWSSSSYGFFLAHSSGRGKAVASIQLPHGAVVTKFSCQLRDTDATYNLDCKLTRESGSLAEIMAEVSSSGSGGISVYPDPSISLATVDNNTYGYTVLVENKDNWATAGGNLGIVRAEIQYTLSEIP